jgi:hypothetical protein
MNINVNDESVIWAPRKISAYDVMTGVQGRGTARLFNPRPFIEAA